MASLNRWKYAINGMANVYHIDEWKIYKDWIEVCKSGNAERMSTFHSTYLHHLNDELKAESSDLTFRDSGWGTSYKLNYNPYRKLMTQSARDIVGDGGPIEAILWFSKQPNLDLEQIVYGINTLMITRKLTEAKLVISLFPNLPFNRTAKDVGSDIFRTALMTGDIPLVHEVWLLGGLQSSRAKELCDNAIEKSWITKEAIDWYNEHRNVMPYQHITGRYDYLR